MRSHRPRYFTRGTCCPFLAASIAVLIVGLQGCTDLKPVVVDLDDQQEVAPPGDSPAEPALRIAVGAMTSPKTTFSAYIELKNHLERELGRRVVLEQRRSYHEVNTLIEHGDVDIAFVCSGAFIPLQESGAASILAVPVVDGKTEYHSYIIVRQTDPIRDFSELQGKRFAFTDPLSNTGRYFPLHRLLQLKRTPDRFFSKVVYTGGHDNSILAVRLGYVDAAAVDHLIFDFMKARQPEDVAGLRVIEKSPAYGIPPVVARTNLDAAVKIRVRDVLLRLHKTKRGGTVLNALRISAFVRGVDADYDSVRQMMVAVDNAMGTPH